MSDKIFDIKQRTFVFSRKILLFSTKIPKDMANQIMLKQLIRCGTSVGANVAEGFAGSSKKDFTNYYSIALKSANETLYWLKLILEFNPKLNDEIIGLESEIEEIAKVLAKIVINCRK